MATEKIVLEGRSRRAFERLTKLGPLKIRLDKSTDEVTRRLARRYGEAWRVIRNDARTMAEYAAQAKHEGGLAPREVARLNRVERGLHTLERQVRDLDKFTGVEVLGGANRQLREELDTIVDSLADVTGLDRRFTKPSGAAIEALVMRSTERIESATRALDADQAAALRHSLLRGLVYGDNPRDTAKRIMDLTEGTFYGGRNRALTLARTEILDANRYATRLAYQENDLVVGWKWLASLSPRTCPACWAMHNTFHEKSEPQYAHANCRCTTVPVLASDTEADVDLGDPEEIFWSLPREEQLQIMGPGRLGALEAGARWTDLTHLRQNPDWRPAYQVTRVSDLQGIAELQVATFPGDVIEVPSLSNASLMSYAYQQGGLTIHALTGDQPTSGYVVARQGTSEVIDAREFFGPAGPPTVAAWLQRHADRLDEPGAHMGMWYDKANGKVVLDVVEILDDRDAAVALGRAEDQIAIFDLDTFTEIPTGGTGGYASNLTADLGDIDVGRTATITRGGEEWTGTVVAAGEWGIRIRTADGKFVNASPDQFWFKSEPDSGVVAEVNEVQKIMATADHGIEVDYSGASVKSAREMDDALDDLTSDWPGIAPTRIEVRSNAGGAFATTHTSFPTKTPTSWIEVDESSAGDYDGWMERMRKAVERGHFHEGAHDEPAEYTIDHEFGHVLDFALFGHPQTREGALARAELIVEVADRLGRSHGNKGITDVLGRTPKPEEMYRLSQIAWQNPTFQEMLTRDLSYYGTQSKFEMVAEGYAVFRDHGPGKSIVADVVMRRLANAYFKAFGVYPPEEGIIELMENSTDPFGEAS